MTNEKMITISIPSKDENIQFDIYLTSEQLEKLNTIGKFWFSYRKVELLKESKKKGETVYAVYPIIIIPGPGKGQRKKLHIGNYLYPEYTGVWNEKIWKNRQWDFARSNLNMGSPNSTSCIYCTDLAVGSTVYCSDCNYVNELYRYAQNNTVNKGLPQMTLDRKNLIGIKNCEVTNLPLIFKSHVGLKAACLERIDKKEGYTNENSRLVLYGLSQLRVYYSEEELFEFIALSGTQQPREIEISPKILSQLKTLKKQKDQSPRGCNLTLDDLIQLLKDTKGICSVSNVPLDLTFDGRLNTPSLDRIDSTKGYFLGNVHFISLGTNFMKREHSTVKEVTDFFNLIKAHTYPKVT